MNVDKISEFIKKLRIENGYSQNTLSEKLHVTRQAVSNWETGKAIPDSQILLELSKLFNVSINNILSGEIEESDLEEIALNLVDENNKKKNIIRKMFLISITIITSLIIIFLGYYFISNYNSIKVYKITGNSNKFTTNNGLLMTTKNKTYIRINEIESLNKNIKYDIKKIKLYYLNKKKSKIVLYDNDTDYITLDNTNGYNEFYINNNKKYLIKNLYLEIKYNDNKKDIVKLSLKEVFSNNFDKLYKNEKSKITRNEQHLEEPNNKINEMIENEIAKTNLYDKVRHEIIAEDKPSIEQDPIIEDSLPETVVENKDNISNTETPQTIPVLNEERNDLNNQINREEVNNSETVLIDYNEIANLIKENGTEEFGTYKYEYIDENENIVSLNYAFNIISIDLIIQNKIESWVVFHNENSYISHKIYENYIETFSEMYNIDYTDEKLNSIIQKFIEKTKSNL